MGRVLLAAAAAISLFALPAAAFGQGSTNTNQAAATEEPAVAAPVSPLLQRARMGVDENAIAALGVALFGATSDNTTLPNFSWGIPRSPALTLAGLSDTKVPTSDSLRSFVVQLPTTLNNEEQGQSIALDITLAQLLSETGPTELYNYRGETHQEALAASFHFDERQPLTAAERRNARTLEDVRAQTPDTYYQRWLRRSRLGVALYEGVEDSSDPSKNIPARLAIGFSTSLWDESDPVMQRGPHGATFAEECQRLRAGEIYAQRLDPTAARQLSRSSAEQAGASLFWDELNSGMGRLRLERSAAPLTMSRQALNSRAVYEETVRTAERALVDNGRLREIAEEAIEDCAQRASEIAELRRDLDIGIGVLYRGDPGQVSDFDDRGAAAWVAFRYPWGVNPINPDFGARLVRADGSDNRNNANSTDPLANVDSYWLVAGSARFSQDEFIATGNDATPEIQVDQSEAWIGIERYSQRFRFGAFYGYSEVEAAEPAGQPFERSGERYVISAQYRVGADENSGIWVGLTYGDTGNAANADNDDALMFSINFAPRPAYTIDWDNDDN